MNRALLVAGIGNLFFGDDGFGVAVARRLAAGPTRPGVTVRDFGISGIHLAYELLVPCKLLLVIDAMSRGGQPGTVYLVEPAIGQSEPRSPGAHGMDLASILDTVVEMGGQVPRTLIIGCEPAELGPGIGLSPAVARAVETAIELATDVVERELAGAPSGKEARQ